MSHDLVLRSLADHLRAPDRIMFLEPNLNGWAMGGEYGSPDILDFTISYSNFRRRIFEVKYSLSDLRSDLREGKWEKYLPLCDRFSFALGHGVPHDSLKGMPVGIIVQRENGTWRTIRAAPGNPRAKPWPQNVLMALLFGKMGVRNLPRAERLEAERRLLLGKEIKDLRYHRWKAISEQARAAHNALKEAEDILRRAQKTRDETYDETRTRMVRELGNQLGFWVSANSTVSDFFSRWVVDIVEKNMQLRLQELNSATPKEENL